MTQDARAIIILYYANRQQDSNIRKAYTVKKYNTHKLFLARVKIAPRIVS